MHRRMFLKLSAIVALAAACDAPTDNVDAGESVLVIGAGMAGLGTERANCTMPAMM